MAKNEKRKSSSKMDSNMEKFIEKFVAPLLLIPFGIVSIKVFYFIREMVSQSWIDFTHNTPLNYLFASGSYSL